MSPTSKPVLPNYTQNAAAYPTNIDAAINAMAGPGFAFAPSAQDTPNMTVRVEAGAVLNGSTLTEISAQSTASIAAPTTNPRIDRVVYDKLTGAVSVVTGTPAASPSAPAIPTGKMPCARVLLSVGQTAITNAAITDERVAGSGVTIDTDPAMAANSDTLVPSQKAVKTAIVAATASPADALARDIAMMTSMIVWRNSAKASGPIPSGFLNTFQTDELATKTNATYDAMNKLYVNQTQATAGPSALSGTALYTAAATVIDRSFSIPNSTTVTYIVVHSSVAFSGKIKIALYVSAGVYNIVVSQSISHTGSGLEWFALTVPYVVPSSGVYNVGVYYNFTGTNVQTVNVSRATVTSDATGDGVSLTESSGSVLPVGVKYTGAALNMILVPAAITIATPKSVALNIEHIPLVTVTLNTDLIAEASIDGGTTWATGQLVKLCDMDATAGSQLLSATIDVSAQTGSSVKWRITTANTKAQSVRCVGIIKAA